MLKPPSLPIYPLDGRPLCSLWSRQAVLMVLALPAAAFMLSHFLPYLRQTRAVFLQQTSAEGTGLAGKRGRAKGRWHRGAGDGWGAASGPGISQSQKKTHESRGISPGPLQHPLRLLFFFCRRATGRRLQPAAAAYKPNRAPLKVDSRLGHQEEFLQEENSTNKVAWPREKFVLTRFSKGFSGFPAMGAVLAASQPVTARWVKSGT